MGKGRYKARDFPICNLAKWTAWGLPTKRKTLQNRRIGVSNLKDCGCPIVLPPDSPFD